MIVELLIGAGALVVGALLPRKPKEKPKLCATYEAWGPGQGESWRATEHRRCIGIADARCLGGNCTKHCRSSERCNGRCIDGPPKGDEKKDAKILKFE